MKTFFLLFLLPPCILSGSKDLRFQLKSDNFQVIKFEDLLKTKKIIKLSDIASDVHYIELETNENCLINRSPKYYFSDSIIFVSNRDHILKFSISGRFIKKIGSPGRGPGELNNIEMISLIPEKRILIVHDPSLGRLTYFSFDGNLIKTISVPSYYSSIKVRSDFTYLARNLGGNESEKYLFSLVDEKGSILDSKRNFTQWKNTTGQVTILTLSLFEPLYIYQKTLYIKTLYNDTVFAISNNQILPSYCIDLGKYKLPDNKIPEQFARQEVDLKSYKNYYYTSVFEAGGKKFITAGNYMNGAIKYFVVNVSKPDGSSSGSIFNDWDGGINFWPIGTVNDKQVYDAIDIVRLKQFFAAKGSMKSKVSSPVFETNLTNMVKKIDEFSNPILRIVTLRPDS